MSKSQKKVPKDILLLSCPGDIPKSKRKIIKSVVNDYNRRKGKKYNRRIKCLYWKDDAYQQGGKNIQKAITEQFKIPNGIDIATILFWTRFGTPTDKYHSGTEEEFEECFSANKQIFLYFIQISTTIKDGEQIKKVDSFRNKLKINKRWYTDINSWNDLHKTFKKDLRLYMKKKYYKTD